ncbi:MAG: 30S ribosomal protein THX [Bacteroidales bacterium]|nr:30S ribosomal protein THX [Bacteroidales bacterium]
MGKGDIKTKRGKLFAGSYGKKRPRKKTVETAKAVKVEKAVKVVKAVKNVKAAPKAKKKK